jgi:hypothetical protein
LSIAALLDVVLPPLEETPAKAFPACPEMKPPLQHRVSDWRVNVAAAL